MKKAVVLVVCSLCCSSVFASDFSLVGSTSFASFTYDDSDGETDSETVTIPLMVGVEYHVSKKNKILGTWRQFDYDVDATTSNDLGANIEANQVNVAWLYKVPLSRQFKPWFGVGIRSSFVEATSKHLVDDEGFLIQVFEDTEDTLMSFNVIANADWRISRDGWYIDTRLVYDFPIGDGLQGYGVSAGLKYKF